MPRGIFQRSPPQKRFDEKYIPVPESGCWLWMAGLRGGGYGSFTVNGKTVLPHRFSYEQKYGKIPDGKQIDHKCRVRSCVNPDHLEIVTCKENLNRGINAESEKTHCPQGHPYSGENLYIKSNGWRGCKTCKKQSNKDYYQRNRDHNQRIES